MEWSKLKNVILLMLLCVNVILLLLVGSQASQDRRYQEETRQAAQAVLEQGGITLALDAIPDDVRLPMVSVTRDRSGEADVAAALLGEVTLEGESEVRPRYVGAGGTAEFSMNGSFTITLRPGVWSLEDGQDYEASSLACLEAMDFAGTLTDTQTSGSETVLTYRQDWESTPLFSCSVRLHWQGEDLVLAEGQRLDGSALSSSQALLSTPTVLVRFLAGINQGGYVCSRIDSMTAGYLSSGTTAQQVQLSPVWQLVTDTGVYYVDASTGAFSPQQ